MRIATAAAICLLALPAGAHHATVTNFTQEIITVEGVIEQVRYQNPHSSILLAVAGDDGGVTYWLVETEARTTLDRKGIGLDGLEIGATIRAVGRKGRRQYTMLLHQVLFEDGSKLTIMEEKQ
jgi:hypothetical protein